MSVNWQELKETDYAAYRDAYAAWMYDERNEFRCAECPHANDGMDKNCADYVAGPCGDQYCWVTCHCHHIRV